MRRRYPVDTFTLPASLLVGAMRVVVEHELDWPQGEPIDSGLRFGRPGDQAVVQPRVLWERLGESISVRDNRRARGIQVRIPDARSVQAFLENLFRNVAYPAFEEFLAELRRHARPEDLPERTIAEVIALQREPLGSPNRPECPEGMRSPVEFAIRENESLDPTSRADPLIQDWVDCFDRMPAAAQRPLGLKLRKALAIGMLRLYAVGSIIGRQPLTTAASVRMPDSLRDAPCPQDATLGGWLATVASFVVILKKFLDAFYWEQSVLPSERARPFLPPGFWPREESEASGGTPALELSEREVPRTDPRVDPARFDFYTQELGCRCVLEPEGWFGERKYVAFLLKAASGARLAFLDCITLDNAVYVFRVGTLQPGGTPDWADEAKKTKWEILSTEGTGRPFLRRFYHSLRWKTRIQSFLANQ